MIISWYLQSVIIFIDQSFGFIINTLNTSRVRMKLIRFFASGLTVKLSSIKLSRNKCAGEQSISNYHKAILQGSLWTTSLTQV